MREPGDSRSGLPSMRDLGGAVTTSWPSTTSLGASRRIPCATARPANRARRSDKNPDPAVHGDIQRLCK